MVPYTHSLERTLSKIEYDLPIQKIPYFMRRHSAIFLKLKDSRSLLIIDDMDCDFSVIQENYDALKQLSVDIIVVNNTSSIPPNLPQYFLEPMPENKLLELFKQHYSGVTDCFNYVFDYFQGHTLSIVLVGKLLSRNKMTLYSFKKSLKNMPFNNISFTNDNIKHNGNRRKLLNHLDSIFDFNILLTEQEQETANNLALFKGVSIPINALSHWIPTSSEQIISALFQKGIVTVNDDCLQMHPLISELLFNREENSKKLSRYFDIIDRISPDIEKHSQQYKNEDIQEILYAIFICLNPKIKFTNNKDQKTLSQNSQTWWNFCQKSIEYFLAFGNTVYANVILQEIYIQKSGIEPYLFQSFDKTFTQLYIDWMNGPLCKKLVSDVLDNLTDLFSKSNHSLSSIPHIYQTVSVCLCRLLDKILITMREDKYDKELVAYYNQTFRLLQITTANSGNQKEETKVSSWRFVISYYYSWYCIFAYPQSYTDIIHYMESLYSVSAGSYEQIRLLADIIYVKLLFYFSYPDIDSLKTYYEKLTSLLESTINIPTDAYYFSMISNIYYALTFPDKKELLTNYLSAIPEITQKIIKTYNNNYSVSLEEAINNVIVKLRTI